MLKRQKNATYLTGTHGCLKVAISLQKATFGTQKIKKSKRRGTNISELSLNKRLNQRKFGRQTDSTRL